MRGALAALVLVGCAQNAVLEITFRVPAAADVGVAGATVALLDFRSATTTTPPAGLGIDVRTAALSLGDAPSTQTVSVVASGEDLSTPLWIGVTYCASATGCLAMDSQNAWLRYERAFYLGEFTAHETPLPVDGVVEIETCRVWGCVGAERPPGGGCDTDGVHVCER